ncbi:MAG TPA: response regulator [Gemmatimonadaceae bacterium]|nr:response regulator [Gemmatimonadaceae bacterium]
MHEVIPTISVVDDDDSVRRALARLLAASGYTVRMFASARELLMEPPAPGPGCLLVDVRMPELNGLELQQALQESGDDRAIVFMTGHGDVQTGVKAMKSGAVDYLLKPFTDEELLEAVARALVRDADHRASQREAEELDARAARLTPREREVCDLVVAGKLNKQIAAALGTSEKTVKVHRARVMAKMKAASLAELVRIVEQFKRAHPDEARGEAPGAPRAPYAGTAGPLADPLAFGDAAP